MLNRNGRPRTVALVLFVVHLIVRAWALTQTFFYADDYRFMTGAMRMSFFPYLFQDYAGHLMPGQFVIVWIVQHAAPGQFWAVSVAILVMQALAVIMVWRLLVTVIGEGWPAVAALTVYMFGPISVTTSIWYATALQTIPLQMAMAGAIRSHVRWARQRRPVDAWFAVAWYLLGLFMWQKSIIIPLFAAVVIVLWFPAGPGLRGVVQTLRRDAWVWAGYVLLTVGYVPLYLSITSPRWRSATAPLYAYGHVLRGTLVGGVVPYLLGGPFAPGYWAHAGPTLTYGAAYLAIFMIIVGANHRPSTRGVAGVGVLRALPLGHCRHRHLESMGSVG
jgi:hypothetical protein